MTGLEALQDIIKVLKYCTNDGKTLLPDEKKRCKIIEKALKDYERRLALAKEYKDVNNVAKRLKALEIIKKFICLGEVIEDDLFPYVLELKEQYVSNSSSNVLSKEEYDLLKEILE